MHRKLNLTQKLFQKSIFEDVVRVSQGLRNKAPIVVDLDPTSFCDLACPECISQKILGRGRLTTRRLETLAQELADVGVRAVIFIGGGEPLLHSGTAKAIDVLWDAGISLGLVTNGTLLNRYASVLAKKMSWVRVSLDAGTAATHQSFRPGRKGGQSFDQIVTSMRNFARRARGHLGYSFLLMHREANGDTPMASNFHELLQAGTLAKAVGCDFFELKAQLDPGHRIVQRDDALVQEAVRQLEALRAMECETFHVLLSSTFIDFLKGCPSQPKTYSFCNIAELRTTVTPMGVYVCPYHRGSEIGRIGDVVSQSFADMWQAANTKSINPSRDCTFQCARHESNLSIIKLPEGIPPVGIQDDYDLFI